MATFRMFGISKQMCRDQASSVLYLDSSHPPAHCDDALSSDSGSADSDGTPLTEMRRRIRSDFRRRSPTARFRPLDMFPEPTNPTDGYYQSERYLTTLGPLHTGSYTITFWRYHRLTGLNLWSTDQSGYSQDPLVQVAKLRCN